MKNILLFDVTNSQKKEIEELFELISSSCEVKYFTHLQDKQKLFWILNL